MRKLISCFMMLSFLLTGISFYPNMVFAKDSNSGWEIKHKKYVVTNSGVDCVSDICVSEAVPNGVDSNGNELYRKKVEVKNDFFLTDNDDYISGNLLCFYFIYNNDEVFLEDRGVMKDKTYNFNKHWKTTSSEEIYTAPEQCIVSQRVGIYNRDTSLQNLENTDEFHIDVICTSDGEVYFNIKDTKISLDDREKVSEATVRTEKLKKKLIREISERDKEYIKDIEGKNNDKYRYITREIYLAYKDDEGNLLADSNIQANFRYNVETHEVQCLSTSNEEQNGKIDVSMRTGNETRTYGGAYGVIKLKDVPSTISKTFEEAIIVKCDSRGKIVTQFVN
ncbi:unknown [Clostridium sp. CAG:557]|nr:unknown [Clostridium sp. CAG:557]